MLDRALKQMQGASGGTPVVIVDHLRKLVGQFAGKGDFVGLPGAGHAGLFQAQHADYLAVDANAGIEHGVDVTRTHRLGHLAGARVVHGVVGIDGAAAVQGFHVIGEAADIDRLRQQIFLSCPVVGGDRQQALAFEVPQAGAVDFVDIAGAAGDQLGGFLQRVVRAVALACEQQNQILLGAHAFQMLQLFLLGTLVQLKGDLQARVLGFQIHRRQRLGFVEHLVDRQQIAAQQVPVVLFVSFAQLEHVQRAGGGVQGVAHHVMRAFA